MTFQGPAITHFEVYTLEDQRWILHARFHGGEREAAVVEAKQVERSLYIATKVVREVYYPGNNTCEETVVYISDKSLRDASATRLAAAARPRNYARPETAGGIAQTAAAQARAKATATRSIGILLKLTIVIIAALVVAGALAGIVSAFANRLPTYGISLSEDGVSLLIFASFVVTFLTTAVPLALSLINWQDGRKRPAKPIAKPQYRSAPPPAAAKEKPPAPSTAADLEEEEDDEVDWEAEPEAEPEPGIPADQPTAPVPDLPKAEVSKPEDEDPGSKGKAPKDKAEDAAADPIEGLRMTMMRFLSTLLGSVKTVRPQLDAYNKFGVDLMLAGAVDVLGNQHHLAIADKRLLLRNIIEVMGTNAETAKAFANKFENYLVEPRYMSMVQMGRSVMDGFASGTDAAADQVAGAFETWNKPQAPQAQARIVTVLFTDMVGSTDLTQARGDHAAQEIVRRHNSIVRSALAEFSGKEVKHTGDGIMASFASPASGVEAATAIQKAVAAHNLKHRELELHLRIGMNAGEPIEEEDDLFGSTVQLAARVCAQAATDQILCTNVVRELSAGRSLTFVAMGSFDLKGFKDKVPLYEVLWDPKAIPEAGPGDNG